MSETSASSLRRYRAPAAFLTAAGPFLARHETAHTVPLGIARGLLREPTLYPHQPYLATVSQDGSVVAVALMTPPHNLILSLAADPRFFDPVAADLRHSSSQPPGVLAPSETARAFAAQWHAITGEVAKLGMSQRLFRLERVRPVAAVPGRLRRATPGDRPLLLAWMEAFTVEALGHADRDRIARAVDLRASNRDGGFFLWEDGEPRAMVGYSHPTDSGVRIAPVYTPPRHRNSGYGSAATAAASQALLAAGFRSCCLFTDLANPTANKIYLQIGYEPVLDFAEYRFSPGIA